jgi:translation initiation factor 2 alpha subunit (eIF-2alpha)
MTEQQQAQAQPSYTGRQFYAEKTPSVETLVVFVVDRVEELAAYGHLPAYADLEAMIPSAEINIRRHRRITDYVRPGQTVVAQVIRVETAGIDLSLKQVRAVEAEEVLTIYKRDAKIDHILRSAVAEGAADTTEELYGAFVWSVGHEAAMERFQAVRGSSAEATVGLPAGLVEAIYARLPEPVYTRTKEITLHYGVYHDGVERLNARLQELAGLEGITVTVTAPPKYQITATGRTIAEVEARLAAASAT